MAATIAPLCGMNIFEILWKLPAAVAYQIFYICVQQRGVTLVDTRKELDLLTRLRRCQKPT